jgi:hypothetical protein
VQFLLTQRNRHTQDLSLAFQVHTTGNQDGCLTDLPIKPYFLVQSIQIKVNHCAQRPVAPGSQSFIRQGSRSTNLYGGYFATIQSLGDCSYFAGRHTLYVHLCQCGNQCSHVLSLFSSVLG